MITIFNRRELYVTYDMKERARVCGILEDNKIDYSVKTTNRMSASSVATGERGRMGTLGQDSNGMYEYKIFVCKSDYEKAEHLMQK